MYKLIAEWTGEVPARSHKPFDVGSIPTSANILRRKKGDAVWFLKGTGECCMSVQNVIVMEWSGMGVRKCLFAASTLVTMLFALATRKRFPPMSRLQSLLKKKNYQRALIFSAGNGRLKLQLGPTIIS